MAERAAHAARHCEAARPRCLSERRRRPPFHPPAFTLRAACGLAMLVGTQARSSAASPKSATVSCKAANPQDSATEQCSSWCKADQEHAQHCTVRHKPQPRIGSTLHALCCVFCLGLPCVLCLAAGGSRILLLTRGSFASARAVRLAEAQCAGLPSLLPIRRHRRRHPSALRRRRGIRIMLCASRGALASSP